MKFTTTFGVAAIGILCLSANIAAANNVGSESMVTATSSGIIDDTTSGWIWHGMTQYDDSAMLGGTAHVGGPGTYGVYTFKGTAVEITASAEAYVTVDGRSHKVGHLKISIDGKAVGSVDTPRASRSDDAGRFAVRELTNNLHVLQVEPEGGWNLIDCIKVTSGGSGVDDGDTPAHPGNVSVKSMIPSGLYRIVSRQDSRLMLAAHDGIPIDGTVAEIYSYQPDHLEVWKITSLGNERYRIAPAGSSTECLSMFSDALASDTAGYKVGTWHTGDFAAEQWYITPTEKGYYRISCLADSNRVLDVQGSNMHDQTSVIGYPWHGSDNQQWGLIPANE